MSSGALAALDEYIKRFFASSGDATDWNVDRYFVSDYDAVQTIRHRSAFDGVDLLQAQVPYQLLINTSRVYADTVLCK